MKTQKHIEYIANGGGAPSVYLMWLAKSGVIPATISITADTGTELNRLRSDGQYTTMERYYDEVIAPLGEQWGIETVFARAHTREGEPMVSIWEHTEQMIEAGKFNHIKIPLFGVQNGQSRLRQACTQRWKTAAIRQTLRTLGATTARGAQGIHIGEAVRRMKGGNPRQIDNEPWHTFQSMDAVDRPVKWLTHYYPYVFLGLDRAGIRQRMEELGIVYLVTSECDICPHKDAFRWANTSDEMLERIYALDDKLAPAKLYLVDERIRLREYIPLMRARASTGSLWDEADFGCGNAECGV